MTDPNTAPQAPAAEPTAPPVASPTPSPTDPAPAEPAGEFKSEESKNAVLADLKKEREARQALEAKVTQFESTTAERNKALAEALGLSEAPKGDDLAETVKSLQAQFQASQSETNRLRVAAEKGVPPEYHYLLTETDMGKLTAQAEMAAEYARLKAAAEGAPQFQPNPGQGQGGQPPSADALADAEYAKYYQPTPK